MRNSGGTAHNIVLVNLDEIRGELDIVCEEQFRTIGRIGEGMTPLPIRMDKMSLFSC